jgi:hypothetical protein
MNISFCDFWGGFQDDNNILTHLLKECASNLNIVPFSQDTDILFYSCYGGNHHQADRSKTKKIFFPGENERPNYNECDFSLSFDFDTYDGKNFRFPLWLSYIDFFDKKTYVNQKYLLPPNFVFKPEENNFYFLKEKTQPCCVLSKHLKNRKDELLNVLTPKMPVHGYGSYFNNGIPDGEDVKMDLLCNYKFHICFENSIFPGYYTEKLLHAKAAGTIPIYHSDSKISEDFNPDSFLNLSNYSSIEEFVSNIIKVDNDSTLYYNIKNTPLFKTPDVPYNILNEAKNFFIKNIII